MEKISVIDYQKKKITSPYLSINHSTNTEILNKEIKEIKMLMSLADATRNQDHINKLISKVTETINECEYINIIEIYNSLFIKMNKLGGIALELYPQLKDIMDTRTNQISNPNTGIKPKKISPYVKEYNTLIDQIYSCNESDYPYYMEELKKLEKKLISDENIPAKSASKQILLQQISQAYNHLAHLYNDFKKKKTKDYEEEEYSRNKKNKESEYYSLKKRATSEFDYSRTYEDYYGAKRKLEKALDYLMTYRKILSDIYNKETYVLEELIGRAKRKMYQLEEEKNKRYR